MGDHFDENYECFEDPVVHTWTEYWRTSGALSFTPPTLDSDMKLVLKSLSNGHHLRDAYCAASEVAKGCAVSTSKNGVDTIFTPASWVGQQTTYDNYYINFGASASGMDFNYGKDIEIYYCYEKSLMYWDTNDIPGTVSNIAGFLSQAAWESGDFLHCEESMHVSSDPSTWKTTGRKLDNGEYYVITDKNAGCTQRQEDGALYADLNVDYRSCDAPLTMKVDPSGTDLKCIPTSEDADSETPGCCWWGRGAMQSTGPSNFGAFQNDVIARTGDYDPAVVNLCSNPSLLCSDTYPDLRWESAFYFWATTVQSDDCFSAALNKYVEAYDNTAESGSCKAFSKGVGGMVNQGAWDKHAHGETGRVNRFKTIMTALKTQITAQPSSTEALPADKKCTGNDAIDWIFWKADLESVSEVNVANSEYSWSSFCSSLKKMIA